MSGTIDDGGPMFPCEQGVDPAGNWNQTFESGMSVRDYFAGQALAGTLAHPDTLIRDWNELGLECYEAADAMLEARKGGSE